MRKSTIWSRGPMASNHVYHAIGLCKICKRVIYKEDLVDEETKNNIEDVFGVSEELNNNQKENKQEPEVVTNQNNQLKPPTKKKLEPLWDPRKHFN